MPASLDNFRRTILREAEAVLEQRYDNCRANSKYLEHAHLLKEELDRRFPGWDKPRTRRGGSRTTIARFREKKSEFETAKAAYVWLVERFAEGNPSLFTDVRWETTGYVGVGRRRGPNGAARNYFAKSPAKLFRQTPSLADDQNNYHRLTNGWYVNVNLNTRQNYEILCRYSAVSKFQHEFDWDWEVLDPTDQLHDARRRVRLAAELMKEFDDFLSAPPATDA